MAMLLPSRGPCPLRVSRLPLCGGGGGGGGLRLTLGKQEHPDPGAARRLQAP